MASGQPPAKPAKPAKEGGKPAPPSTGPKAAASAAPATAGSAASSGATPPSPTPSGSSATPATGLDEKALSKMPPQLRQAYEAQHKELQAVKSELTALKAKPADDPEKKVLLERNQAHEKRIQELEEELKYTSYERTQEYKDQYLTPFEEAYNQGRAVATELRVINPEDGSQRQGMAEDFDSIMTIGNTAEANAKAVELFGTEAPLVMAERRAVILANNRRVKAIEDYRKNGAERDKQRVAQTAAQREAMQKKQTELLASFQRENTATIEQRAELMKADETDTEGVAILKKEQALADLAYGSITPEQIADLPQGLQDKLVDGKLPPEERVRLDSAIWAKARAFGFVVRKLNQAKAKVTELETALAAYGESTPTTGGGHRRPGTGEKREMTPFEEIDAMAAENA